MGVDCKAYLPPETRVSDVAKSRTGSGTTQQTVTLAERLRIRELHCPYVRSAMGRYRQGSLTYTEALEVAMVALSEEVERLRDLATDLAAKQERRSYD